LRPLSSVAPHRLSCTGTALPFSAVGSCVFGGVLVPGWAVRFLDVEHRRQPHQVIASVDAPLRLSRMHLMALLTHSADSHIGDEVFGREFVAAFAVRFRRIQRRWADASRGINAARDRLQMRWSNAAPDSTEMIERQAFWDGANHSLIRPPMRANVLRGSRPKRPVPTSINRTRPEPAAIRLGNLRHESFIAVHVVSIPRSYIQ